MNHLKKIFSVLVIVFLMSLFSNVVLTVNAAFNPPACGFSSQSGRTIVNFDRNGGLRADFGENDATQVVNGVFIPAGTYNVGLHSYDNHFDKFNPDQVREQFFVQFLNSGGGEITRSNSINDIPDNTENVVQFVNNGLSISQNVNSLILRHSAWPSSNPNSLLPVCMALDPIAQPPPPPPPNNPPVINFCNSPGTATVGNTATISYSVFDPDGDPVTITISWGDGTTTLGGATSAQHVYGSTGTFAVTITATDIKGAVTQRSCGFITVISVPPPPNNPPVINSCSSPSTVNVGSTTTITYSVFDPDGDSVSISINWGDGSTTTGGSSSASHTYNSAGTFFVTITATDSKGAVTQRSCGSILVKSTPPPNNPPVINSCSSPSTIGVGNTAVISYSVTDPDGNPVTIRIDWGDGTTTTGGSSSATHTYTSTGTFTVTITATDSKGAVTQGTCGSILVTTITPPNNPPVITSCTSPSTIIVGNIATVNYVVSDPDGDAVTITINWGDGTTTNGGASGAQHIYTSTGTFPVTITATDSKGLITQRTCGTVNVISGPGSNPPVINSCNSPSTVNVGNTATITYSVSDPDGDTVTISVNWGDGTTTTGGSGSASHVYSTVGSFPVTITATDSKGAVTQRICGTVNVIAGGNQPPVISSCNTPSSITLGNSATISYTITDPNSDPITVSVAWGDGTTTTGGSSSATHTYTSTGTFTVTITASDGKGGVTTQTCGTITVTSTPPPPPPPSGAKLKITDVDAKVDRSSDNNLRDGETISRDAEPESMVELKVEVTNLFNSTGLKINDIVVTVTIEDIDDGDDMEEESREFDLRPGRDKRSTFKFKLPLNIEDGDFNIAIEAEGTDEDGNDHSDDLDVELEVQKERHDLRLQRLNIDKSKVKCDTESFTISYTIINLGEEDEDKSYVEIINRDLGLNFVQRDISIDAGADDNTFSGSHTLKISNKVENATYPITVNVYSDDGRVSDTKTINLEVVGCDLTKPEDDKRTVTTSSTIYQVVGTDITEETFLFPFLFRGGSLVLLLLSTFALSILFVLVSMIVTARAEE
ncbi:hypothetical protein CMO83_00025 [Candidatus Woesearchaeota archaeon]|jgi:PKD repeat protein|nr:hypothetical protein [Candidatus Woesearchaeota archaeon]